MAVCSKCNTANEEGLTRCGSCNAIMPVKLGSKSEVRYERVRRKAELVGTNCPKCGTVNPYTRFKCKSCGTTLTAPQTRGIAWARVWAYVGLAAAALAAIAVMALRSA